MAKKIADAEILEDLVKKALEQGADNAAVVPVSAIETDAGFRSLCAGKSQKTRLHKGAKHRPKVCNGILS